MSTLKIAFAGTPVFGLPCLKALYNSHHHLVAVYTQPDRPAGRGRQITASPVKSWAIKQNIPVYQPSSFKQDDAIHILESLDLDLMVVIAYGLILPERVLQIPKYGCINGHASILPRWRGASPIQRAIQYGDKTTGITVMQMDKGMDTGDMLSIASLPIEENDTGGSLHDKLAELAVKPMLDTIERIGTHAITPTAQNDKDATYAPKILKQDAHIKWHDKAPNIRAMIRAFNPWPVAYTIIDDKPIKIFETKLSSRPSTSTPGTITEFSRDGFFISTGDTDLQICTLQLPGKKPVKAIDLLNGQAICWEKGLQCS
tara:strand:- start:369 stop:1313 length:945 start_codon:yes stop_codon:yes gene_type:complete